MRRNPAEDGSAPSRSHRGWALFGALLGLVLLLLAVGAWTFPSLPDVRGMTEEQAQRELEAAGFEVAFAQFPPPYRNIPCYLASDVVGIAIGQDPCPGPLPRVRRGTLITVWMRLPDLVCNAPRGSGCA
jgi:PASTA domain